MILNSSSFNGDPSVLNCPQTDTEDDRHVLREEVEAAVQSLKKGKLAGVDNISAELAKAGREDVIATLTTVCKKICQTEGRPTLWTQSLVCPRKATCSSVRTIERSVSSATQTKSC